jgi:hypothetical protein
VNSPTKSPSPTDRITEGISRWVAARTSRRTFIANAGRAAVVAAGGATIAGVFSSRAEARVCGQSGVSPKCPTYDCDTPDVWGWCWYANAGCCADGGIKKICDCCRTAHPNVHGYCPEGTNVYCVVESCLEDPRVMKVPVERYMGATSVLLGLQRSQHATAGSAAGVASASGAASVVVIADGDDPLMATLAFPVAADLGAPLVLSHSAQLVEPIRAELVRLGAQRFVVVGSNFSLESIRALSELGAVEQIGAAAGVAAASIEVAQWLIARSKRPEVFCLGAGSLSTAVCASVGTYAALKKAPILVSPDAVSALRRSGVTFTTTFVSDEVSLPGAARGDGDSVLYGSDPTLIARELMQRAFDREPRAMFGVVASPANGIVPSIGLAAPGSLVLLYPGGGIDPELRDWIEARRGRFTHIDVALEAPGSIDAQGVYQLQAAANGFRANLLIGGDGQGLPVITMPLEERERGKARISGDLPATTKPPFTTRGKPTKQASGQASTQSSAKAPPVSAPTTTLPK